MVGIGLHVGPHVPPNDAVLADLRRMNPPTLLMLEGSYGLAAHMPPSCLTIARDTSLMVGFSMPSTAAECYAAGVRMANAWLSAHRRFQGRIIAVALINEPVITTVEDALLLASFDAGAANVFDGENMVYIAGNWAMGTPEPEIIVAYAQAFLGYDSHDFEGVGWGYHAYTDGFTDHYWLERRPWDLWQPALTAAGIIMPPIVETELGYDARIGYRAAEGGSERHADYLRHRPALTPKATGRCLYVAWGTADWATWDIAGDETVIAAIAEINAKTDTGKETPMPTDRAHEIWDMAWRWPELPKPGGYNPNTAIATYREGHPLLGMPLSNEYTRDTWPVVMMVFAGGVALARKGDWKTSAAMTENDVRVLLAGPLA